MGAAHANPHPSNLLSIYNLSSHLLSGQCGRLKCYMYYVFPTYFRTFPPDRIRHGTIPSDREP